MPIDSDGNRADIIMDPNSTISRMNVSRCYEQYINAASRDAHKNLCLMLNVKPNVKCSLNNLDETTVKKAFDYLLNYYKIVSPKMHSWFFDGSITQEPREFLEEVVERGIHLFIPTNNEPESEDIILQLEEHYKPVYGPVTYIGNSGRQVVTKKPVRIGSVYIILLEKIGDDWSAVDSGKLQHFGVLSQLTKNDKYSRPARNQAVRGSGEAEVRILASYVGEEHTAEIMDRNNSPQTHKLIVKKILESEKPTNIESMIDRSVHRFGGAKPVGLVKHILQCQGVAFKYSPYKDIRTGAVA